MKALVETVDRNLPAWKAFRRDLHRFPELGFTEFRTASLVADRLARLGFTVRVGREVMDVSAVVGRPAKAVQKDALERAMAEGANRVWAERMEDALTGVVGDLRNGSGPTIAFRFDMDALPLQETLSPQHRPQREGFSSEHRGVMHACGHDGHTAIGIAVAELASEFRDRWNGNVRLIFQPAEEGGRGARPMVAAGVVDDADYFFAAHLGCDLPSGHVATAAESMLFSLKWDVTFTGAAAHAAGKPQDGRNALLAGASAALNLHAIARHGTETTTVNVGRMTAGNARNVVPVACDLEMEIRGETEASLSYMSRRSREIVDGTAVQHGVARRIECVGATIGEPSDELSRQLVRNVASRVEGVKKVVDAWPLGGGDDAAFFMRRLHERRKCAGYFLIGSSLHASHHDSSFDFDEESIAIGAQTFFGLLSAVSIGIAEPDGVAQLARQPGSASSV